ncbi:MAG: hypothetical protein M9962_04950 [Oligoflexia bacterium]|nr:hypothetical protein [Oligoflexia bacterium]
MTRSFSQINFLRKGILFLFLLTAFSCSSQSTDSETMPEFPASEADLLDNSEQATEVADSSIFSDLNPTNEPSAGLIDNSSSNSLDTYVDDGAPFYSPVGGEKLGRVAYTLYGNRNKVSLLEEKNPGITREQQLSTSDKVYFDFAGLNPQVRLLTKDLIERYPAQLAESIQSSNGLSLTTTVVAQGETLQMISQRLYGTTRYWTEIYLLNHKELKNYDTVRPGISLSVYQRDVQLADAAMVPASTGSYGDDDGGYSAAADTNQVMDSQEESTNLVPSTPTQSNNRVEQRVVEETIPEQPADPIPDMGAAADARSMAEPTQVAPPPPAYTPQELATSSTDEGSASFLGSTTNLRRVVFVALVVIIGLVAFFMTGSKRKKKFDMLDVTSTDTAGRPKLQKNANNKDVG